MSSVSQQAESSKPSTAAALEARERWPPDEHDGLSEHPPAAVLLLVLGEALHANSKGYKRKRLTIVSV